MLSLLQRLWRLDSRQLPEGDASYIRNLIALLRRSPLLGLQARRPPSLVEPLTARELDVLRLLGKGLDNQSVAGEMSIRLQTVKTHLTSIYGKLGVAGRRDAAERARELGLLRMENKPAP